MAYGTFGLFAVVGLIVHGLLTVALMGLAGSALTLPGIAGLVLGIAMAVDANVLIYERIREELRAGKTPISAIDAGFTRAFITIADSQLTTLACAMVMFWLGSGPIRGFAGHAHHRHLHVHIRVRDRCAAHHLLLAQFDAADAPHH
jgi:preprotein translocase subunit SecD